MARFLTLNGLAACVGRSWYGAAPALASSDSAFDSAEATRAASRFKFGRLSAALFLAGAVLIGAASEAYATEKMLPGSMIIPEGTTGFGTGVNEGNTTMVAMIRERGVEPGPGVGMVLAQLLAAVMAGEVPNEREALLDWLRW